MQKFIALALLLTLAVCGYQPMLAKREWAPGQSGTILNQVRIGNIANREGQQLRNELTNRFYTQANRPPARYELAVKLRFNDVGLGIQRDATAARSQLVGMAEWSLRDVVDNREVLKTTSEARASYNRVTEQYALLTAEENAKSRVIEALAEQMTLRIAALTAPRE
jgi:LPS-assembly lipoprotein